MTNKEFVQKAIDAAKNYKTIYANGMFGSLITEQIIAQKAKQLPGWYTAERQSNLRKLIGKGYFGFDCVCFVKGLLWGWNGSILEMDLRWNVLRNGKTGCRSRLWAILLRKPDVIPGIGQSMASFRMLHMLMYGRNQHPPAKR